MYHPRIKGTYYDMGYNYGAALYKHGFRVSEQSAEKLDFKRKSEKEVDRVFPEILEEIQGLAEACHASYEQLATFILSIGVFKVEPMCSAFAAFNGSDTIVGRNYDFYYSFKKYIESYLTLPENGYRSVGHTDIFVGREDGVNEKGLAIAMTGVAEKTIKPGINFPLATRCILDKCTDVEEGVELLLDARLSTTTNYLLADREGDMVVMETSPKRTRVRRPVDDDNFIVCANHFLHPEMLEMEDQKERSGSNWDSVPRYATIYGILEKEDGQIDMETAQQILSNHTGYVCSHQQEIQLGTIWSISATLRKPQIFRAEGHPCRAKYRLDNRLNKALRIQ